ncbi:MAG: phosphoenolpyruvate--protein phosphotransferase [Desulfuromonadales bacterium GWD2_61_12]|nr:MAG: phosphoenolpyruvate--protein phosphotransferase [Desulfuromonadales bacterium GWC2_61_20]OGR36442.1 MAG: phosphoenolpyruvate--protein phosphotransferase [Desulfuromonadales bacterium GWD2_61_12]HAD03395.1 phosphoenolpyruvate--protein phosphotransferase [Desulfuromonas sp.]
MAKRASEQFGIATLEDISTLILHSHDLDETLDNIVTLVAKRMRTEVCSIYLLDDDAITLRLRASRGLSRKAIGKVSLKMGEGLTGLAAEERRIVAIQEPQNHPRYKYFKETGEERYHSFLGLPLFDRKAPLGVVAIQTKDPREFSAEEISALSTIAFQVSSIVINARLLDSIRQKEAESTRFARELESTRQTLLQREAPIIAQSGEVALRGAIAYPGVTSGPAHVMDERLGFADVGDVAEIDCAAELDRLESAIEKTRIQTLYLEKRVAERLSSEDAAIFHTHLMILEDRGFIDKLKREIETRHSAAYALKKVVGEYLEAFGRMDDQYLRERAADMEDIGKRLLANLVGGDNGHFQLHHPGILVARELLPSDMAALDHEQIRGIVTEAGEKNSHAVIMAKSLGIPALVGVKGLLKQVNPDDPLILDANSGCLYVKPAPRIISEYKRLEEDSSREIHRLEEFRDLPALTKDGIRITLRANIGLVSDVDIARRNGAEGVGLYRTEFPYMARSDFPDRDDQYQLYRRVVEGFDGKPVTIRTLDIGGDKALPYFSPPVEDNPFMGWRSVRVSLDNRDIFRTQIEAILMAGLHGPVKILFPMISGLEELRACREVIAEASRNLSNDGIYAADTIPFGIMIEVPAAVQMAERLAREVDFFALGTNDLIQYMLAADRNNPLVKRFYEPLHPAILSVLNQVSAITRRLDKGLCLCGEMASDPVNLIPLIGMGIREFSMPAPFIPRTKAFLQGLDSKVAAHAAKEVLAMDDSTRIRAHLTRVLERIGNDS